MMAEKGKEVASEDYYAELETSVENFKAMSETYRDRWDSLQKWLLATCVSVNGASLVAVLGFDEMNRRSAMFAAGWFFIGCCVSILYAMISAHMIRYLKTRYYRLYMALRALVQRGDQSKMEAHDDASLLEYRARFNRFVNFQYLSFLCFLIGGLIAAEGLS